MPVNNGMIQARQAKLSFVPFRLVPITFASTLFVRCLLTSFLSRSDLAAERLDQLADLFVAVRDKGRPCDFEAGLKGRKRRKFGGGAAVKEEKLEGLDEFRKRYNTVERCVVPQPSAF